MTAALAHQVAALDLPPEPGISPRAVRAVFQMMAKIAANSGEFKYGIRGSKLADLTGYSLSVVRRAQRYLVDHGHLERVQVGGGRASTKWRIPVEKLGANRGSRHSSDSTPAHQPDQQDTAQDRRPKSFFWMNPAGDRVEPGSKTQQSKPPASVLSILNPAVCEHGGLAGTTSGGLPRCASCRRRGGSARK